jgi:hypothetical protein
MSMPKPGRVPNIRLERQLKVPPVPAFSSLKEILSAIAAQDRAWRGFALHVSLGDLRLPDVGYVAVPIALHAGESHAETRSVDFEITAAEHASSFPEFRGAAGIDATGPTGSIFWLAGTYDVPLQIVGKLFDKTIASGIAERALHNLADDFSVAIVAHVDKSEAEYVRYRMY